MNSSALADVLGAVLPDPVTVTALAPLTGGASAETWALDAVDGSGAAHELIVRRGGGQAGLGLDPRVEPLVQSAAHAASVPVARVVATFTDHATLGTGYVMDRLAGETIPRRLLRDERYSDARSRLARDCADALSRIHAVPYEGVPDLPRLGAADQLALLENLHRSVGHPVPTFELGFRWLRARLPPDPSPLSLVHGDFRLGNLLVDERGLVAVLDWELAHLGDPMEDIGWLRTRAWRFGGPGEIGGFDTMEEFSAAYDSPIDPTRVHFWEAFGSLRWGIICQLQTCAHLRGTFPSVERAAIGRRVTEAELDLLLLIC
jgi:aminoglycoside phosphotransferase (APT) family kinase protein